METVKAAIRDVPDFPKPGVMFKDITPVLSDPKLFRYIVEDFTVRYRDQGITKIVGIESRGFIFGTPLTMQLNAGFVPLRKKGKLPHKTLSVSFDLEYGSETLEIHEDALTANDRVLIVDDLLATGGTAGAAIELVSKCGAEIVELAFFIELGFLGGRKKLNGANIYSQITF